MRKTSARVNIKTFQSFEYPVTETRNFQKSRGCFLLEIEFNKQVSKKRNIFGWCQWSTSSTAVSPFFRVSFKKVCTNLLKKKELKVYYFIAKSIKEVNEICDAQLYIASKIAFCRYYTHR